MTEKTRRRWPWLVAKLLVVALLVWFIRDTLLRALDQLEGAEWTIDPVWLVVSGALYLLGQLPSGLYFHRTLLALGQWPSLWTSLRAYYIGHLGKYVPGKALVVVLRAGLVRGPHVDTTVAVVCVFVETLTMMAVGAFLAAAVLAVSYRGNWTFVAIAVGLMFASGLPTLPPIFRMIIRRLGVVRRGKNVSAALDRLDWRVVVVGWPMMIVGWIVLGASLLAVLKAIGIHSEGVLADLAQLTAASALSTVAGFLSMIPGGLGVRDFILTELLGPYFEAQGVAQWELNALAAAVLMRLVSLIAELVMAGLLALPISWAKRPAKEHSG